MSRGALLEATGDDQDALEVLRLSLSRSRLRSIDEADRLYLPLGSHGRLGGARRALRPSG